MATATHVNDPRFSPAADSAAARLAETEARLRELLAHALERNGQHDLPTVNVSNDWAGYPVATVDIPIGYLTAHDGDDAALGLAVELRAIADVLDGLVRREWTPSTKGISHGSR